VSKDKIPFANFSP
jgi:hypothetical protein